jgi:hypothetical protein
MDVVSLPSRSDPEYAAKLQRDFFIPDWLSVEDLLGEREASSQASPLQSLAVSARDAFLRYDALASGMIGDQRLYHRSVLGSLRSAQKDIAGCMAAPGTCKYPDGVLFHSPSPWHTLLLLVRLQERCMSASDGGFALLFRGQADANWQLESSFERLKKQDRKTERATLGIFSRLIKKCASSGGIPLPGIAVEALAQHYGIRTRLLDFTTDPATALWFATDRPGQASTGAVYALNVPQAVKRGGKLVFPPPFVERLYVQHGTFIDTRYISPRDLREQCFAFSFDHGSASDSYEVFRLGEPLTMYPRDPWIEAAVEASRASARSRAAKRVDLGEVVGGILRQIGSPSFLSDVAVDRQRKRWIKECYLALYRVAVAIHSGSPSITIFSSVLDAFARANQNVCRMLIPELRRHAVQQESEADVGLAEALEDAVLRLSR